MSDWKSIKSILDQIRQRHPALDTRLSQSVSILTWEKTVGELIAKHAKPLGLRDKTLLVVVDHPVWKAELHQRKRQILEKLNLAMGENNTNSDFLIEDLFFLDERRGGNQR